jgi:hypothetical protein
MEEIIIRIKGDSKDVENLIKQLEKTKQVDNDVAKTFKKNNEDFKHQQKEKEVAVKNTAKTVSSELGGLNSQLKNIGGMIAGYFSVQALIGFTKAVVDTRAEFQKLEAVLTNTLGSNSEAQLALKQIQDFAAATPFSVQELTSSFVKLVNQGFKPTMDEMTKLGDIAASQGKSFDQLTEAIIDAQTGEFERLKEFGIRAKKEGDNVTFTFKGVEKQVKFTSESIRQYVLGIGSATGVTGAMNAISKTLGGQISNLGDAWDSLLNTIGGSSEGVFSGVISGLSSLISGIEGAFKSTGSAIEDERANLNQLVFSIANANEGTEKRKVLIQQLKAEYPDFLKGLNSEKVTNEELFRKLKDVNNQYILKLSLQRFDEKNLDILEKQSDANIDLADATSKLTNEIFKQATAEQLYAIAKTNRENPNDINIQYRYASAIGGNRRELGKLTDAYSKYIEKFHISKKADDDANKILRERNNLLTFLEKRYGKLDEAVTTTTQSTKEDTKSTEKQKNALELLIAQQALLKKELELQSVTTGINVITLQKYLDVTKKITDAQKALNNAIDPSLQQLQTKDDLTKQNTATLEKSIEESVDLRKNADDEILVSLKNTSEGEINIAKQTADAKMKLEKMTHDQKMDLIDGSFQVAQQGIMTLQAMNDASLEYELRALEDQLDKKEISEEEFDQKQRELKRKTAEENKQLAIFNILLNTAQAVISALAMTPPNPILAVTSGIVGALQLAAAISYPVPQFAKGTDFLKRGSNKPGVDTIPIMANEGEAIIPTDMNQKHPGLAAAWIRGNLDDFINVKYIMPSLAKKNNGDSFADKIAKAISINNNNGFYDGNLIASDKDTRKLLKEQTQVLKKMLNRSNNSRYAG